MPRTKPRSTVAARMLALLADGRPHARAELRACLVDELGATSNIQPHLSRLRLRLRPIGQDIVCVLYRWRICYQQVILIPQD